MQMQARARRISTSSWFLAVVYVLFCVTLVKGSPPTGLFEFQLSLAPRCLNGTFPATVTNNSGSITGTVALATDTKGRITGQWTGGGVTFPLLGRLKIKSGMMSVSLSGTDGKLGSIKFSGTVQDPLLSGPVKGTKGLAGLTGTLIVDLSSASVFTAVATVNLTTTSKGVVSGTGDVTFCGMTIPVTAKGKASNTKFSLSLTAKGYSFSCSGVPTNGIGFDVTWKGPADGSTASGKGLLVVSEGIDSRPNDIGPLPTMYVDPSAPAGGGQAVLTVNAPGATSISLTATGQGCGAFMALTQSGSSLVDTQTAGAFGDCLLTADITTSAGTGAIYQTSFTVQPTELQLPDRR